MSVDLTGLPVRSLRIRPLDFGGLMGSALGGATLRLDRLGNRYAVDVETAPMKMEPEGRKWAALLMRARREGAILSITQADFDVSSPGAPKMSAAAASGRTLALKGLTPFYEVKAGQWLNYIRDGRRYLDQVSERAIAGAGGAVSVGIQNLIRAPLALNDAIDLATPKIEGWMEGDFSLDVPLDRITSFAFTVAEKS